MRKNPKETLDPVARIELERPYCRGQHDGVEFPWGEWGKNGTRPSKVVS